MYLLERVPRYIYNVVIFTCIPPPNPRIITRGGPNTPFIRAVNCPIAYDDYQTLLLAITTYPPEFHATIPPHFASATYYSVLALIIIFLPPRAHRLRIYITKSVYQYAADLQPH